jgi:hypothetical protein
MKSISLMVLMILTFGMNCGIRRDKSQPVISTSICAIVQNPKAFDKRAVSFRATVLSDGIENTILLDSQCAGQGIAAGWTAEEYQPPGVANFIEALRAGRRGTADKYMVGTFTGAFFWEPGARPERRVVLTDVRELAMIPRVGAPAVR